jgi:hypothetical protein
MRLIVHFEDDRCRPRRFYGLSFYLAGNFLTNHARAYSQPDGPAFFTISQHSKSLRAIDSLASNISDSPYFVPVSPQPNCRPARGASQGLSARAAAALASGRPIRSWACLGGAIGTGPFMGSVIAHSWPAA